MMNLFVGLDLAWGETTSTRPANETGVASMDAEGRVVNAGWTRGLDDTVAWVQTTARADTALAVDAPLVVTNPTGQRACETQVGQRYGRWQVSANTSNMNSPRLAGVALRQRLEDLGWTYITGLEGRPDAGRHLFEVYPYTTLVGAAEFGYDDERPRYKRKPKSVRTAEWRVQRAVVCDDLLSRMGALETADPPLLLRSHPMSRQLLETPSPLADAAYKHREDLIDALLCAWTASLWSRHGGARVQVLGDPAAGLDSASIVAPARPEQRGPASISRACSAHRATEAHSSLP